jgi:hypothetical protein
VYNNVLLSFRIVVVIVVLFCNSSSLWIIILINPMWNQVEVIRLALCESRSISIMVFSHSIRSSSPKGTIAKYPVGVAGTVKVRDKLTNNKR